MSVWTIHERTRNIGTKAAPHYVTIWTGRDENGQRRWLVNSKPNPLSDAGPIYAAQGGPQSAAAGRPDASTLREAVAEYKASAERERMYAE